MQAADDGAASPSITGELARGISSWRFRDPVLEVRYTAEWLAKARPHNRLTIAILVTIFDLFFIPDFKTTPEIVGISAFFRFGILTPATCTFLLLDWRGTLGRWYYAAVALLAAAPTLESSIEFLSIVSPAALPDIQAVPLLQLAVLTWRMNVPQASFVVLVSVSSYIFGILHCQVVPAIFLPSMMLQDIAIGVTVLVYAFRTDWDARQVFLLGMQAECRRAALAAQNEDLARMSHLDALTGVGNRRSFNDALALAWCDAAQREHRVALLMFDIDKFKTYNDQLGHPAGDACLQQVAKAAAGCLRRGDTIARYGGEEFGVILPGASLAEAAIVGERVRQAVLACRIEHPAQHPPGWVSVSVGVASLVTQGQAAQALVQAADACLYAAKRAGRNQVCTAAVG